MTEAAPAVGQFLNQSPRLPITVAGLIALAPLPLASWHQVNV